jgi:hypothetical protein
MAGSGLSLAELELELKSELDDIDDKDEVERLS